MFQVIIDAKVNISGWGYYLNFGVFFHFVRSFNFDMFGKHESMRCLMKGTTIEHENIVYNFGNNIE